MKTARGAQKRRQRYVARGAACLSHLSSAHLHNLRDVLKRCIHEQEVILNVPRDTIVSLSLHKFRTYSTPIHVIFPLTVDIIHLFVFFFFILFLTVFVDIKIYFLITSNYFLFQVAMLQSSMKSLHLISGRS